MHTNNKMATEDDVYDVVLDSSSYLYAFVKFSRRRNKLDVDASGFTTCCVEMTWVNMPDSYKNFGWAATASTDTFGCQQSSLTVFWAGGTTPLRLSSVCVAVHVQGRTTSYDVVRSRTTPYVVKRSTFVRTTSYNVRRTTYVVCPCVRSMNAN